MPESIRRLCIQWPRFGPYHLARLQAVHALLDAKGVELIALETAGEDMTYAWRVEADATPFRREQVFPDASLDTLAPAQVHEGITAALDRLQPDALAINSYGLPDARACLMWARRHHRTAVLMSDSKADDAPRIGWREWIKRQIVQEFDAGLVAGTPQRRYYHALGIPESHLFLGYDVVDNAFFATRADQVRQNPADFCQLPGLEAETRFFLASNRFITRKNLPFLLRAYTAYRAQVVTPWRLVLLGDGPERGTLEQLIAAQAMEGVTLAGFRQIDELPAYYGLASAFVHPALTDQWGLVVNEAMAAGLPVLVSTGAGCAFDLVEEGGNGYRFAPTDEAQLAALLQHIASPETNHEAMGQRSRALIAHWSPEVFAERLWKAVEVGHTRRNRPFRWTAQLLLEVLRWATRSSTAFHSVES